MGLFISLWQVMKCWYIYHDQPIKAVNFVNDSSRPVILHSASHFITTARLLFMV